MYCLVEIDKHYFKNDDDIYLGVTYIVPEFSPIHDMYNVDIFRQLECDTNHFNQLGQIFLTGDMNSRTAGKHDFIDHDRSIDGDVFHVDTCIESRNYKYQCRRS